MGGERAENPDGGDGFTRRRVLQLGVGAVMTSSALPRPWAGATTRSGMPAPRAGAGLGWPQARLSARDATRVNESQFMPELQLLEWQRELDALGMRATGSPVQEGYVDVLHDRLERAGVRDVHFESLPHRRWLADSWSLHVNGRSIPTASYIPYSGETPPGGVTGPLVEADPSAPIPAGSLRGKIALFFLALTSRTFSEFGAIAYQSYDPAGILKSNRDVRPRVAVDFDAHRDARDARAGRAGGVRMRARPPGRCRPRCLLPLRRGHPSRARGVRRQRHRTEPARARKPAPTRGWFSPHRPRACGPGTCLA